MSNARAVVLQGWGRTSPSTARLHEPRTLSELRREMAAAGPRGVITRGLGRSSGDAAQNGGGDVLVFAGDLADPDLVMIDGERGVASAPAGVALDDLIRVLLPQRWFLPVTPATRFVTLGGAIAADAHGKNHHLAGTVASHLRSLELVDGRGNAHVLTPGTSDGRTSDAERKFWATAGGMGLTGVITRATFDLTPVTSAWMRAETERAPDLDALMARMAEPNREYRYASAWVDTSSGGRATGRGVITRGAHARVHELPVAHQPTALRFAPGGRVAAPPHMPGKLLNRWTARAFNEALFRRAPHEFAGELVPMADFFYSLDAVRDWNRVYGPRGFVQYQFAVPDSGSGLVAGVIEQLRAAGAPGFMAQMQRLGAANPGPLSFPLAGWSFTVDLPAETANLGRLLDRLDEQVAAAGGRVYLARDARLRPAILAAMYPRLGEWRSVRATMDPAGRFVSDLSRRLEI